MTRGRITLILFGLVVLLVYFISPGSIAWTINNIHIYWMGIISSIGFLAAIFGVFSVLSTSSSERTSGMRLLLGGMLLGFVCLISQLYVFPYLSLNHIRQRSVVVTEENTEAPGYRVRPIPYEIARNILNQNMGDFPGTEVSLVTYIHDGDEGVWTAVANGQDWFKKTRGIVSLHEDGTMERCEVTMPALGGSFWNSATNAIRRHYFLASIIWEDAYGTCENSVGTLYVPLRRLVFPTARPEVSGLAVIDARGNVHLANPFEISSLPGPTYPASIVKVQERSLNTAAGFLKFALRQFGFQVNADPDDPNFENPGQWILVPERGAEPQYVSQHVPLGSTRAIVYQSYIPVKQYPSFSDYNLIVFERYAQPLVGNYQVDNNVSPYIADPALWNILDVWEVVPGPGKTRVAYVGEPAKLWYIVTVHNEGHIVSVKDVREVDFSVHQVEQSEELESIPDDQFLRLFQKMMEEFLRRER